MIGSRALDKGDGAAQHPSIAGANAIEVSFGCQPIAIHPTEAFGAIASRFQ